MLSQSIHVFHVLDCIITCVLMILEIERQTSFEILPGLMLTFGILWLIESKIEIWQSKFEIRFFWIHYAFIEAHNWSSAWWWCGWFFMKSIFFPKVYKMTSFNRKCRNWKCQIMFASIKCIKIIVSTTRMCNKLSWKSLGFWMMCQITEWIAWIVNMQFLM